MLRCLRERKQTPAEANSEALSFEGAPNNTWLPCGVSSVAAALYISVVLRELLLGVFLGRAIREKHRHAGRSHANAPACGIMQVFACHRIIDIQGIAKAKTRRGGCEYKCQRSMLKSTGPSHFPKRKRCFETLIPLPSNQSDRATRGRVSCCLSVRPDL
ncbi:hypothetical protein EDB86DRAFT_1235151 [Lactarius hatsudake]|nr:hypothetical protein EDB86DRAFT_1235151 [Lactarius hatsudake]